MPYISMRSSISPSYVFDLLPFPKKYISDIAQQFVHFILVFTTDAFAKRNLNPFKMILQIAVNVH